METKAASSEIKRIIGNYTGNKKGPLLIITAGVHGNEPSGIHALQRIFAELEHTKPSFSGKLIGIAGNVAALNKNVRFIDEDLNRTWTAKNLSKTMGYNHEETEMREIIEILEKEKPDEFSLCYFMDCHSTSSESIPYISVQDVGKNNTWAHQFPVFIVKGFSDIVNGSIDKYFSKQGMTGFTFEAGQHNAKNTSKHHEGLIWLALKKANKLDLKQLSCYPECTETIENNDEITQKTFEITYRHGLTEKDDFKMLPNFDNFQKITKGELLAMQNGKEIRSKWNARIFMPLYQAQGNDGFFVVKETSS